jgi:hypothetical protein
VDFGGDQDFYRRYCLGRSRSKLGRSRASRSIPLLFRARPRPNQLEQIPPANWIPMVPVVAPAGARYFRCGILVRPGYGDVHAARLLEPGQPFFVADECIPRKGTEVTRYFRRTRWTDGSTVTWLAHRGGPGLGPGWSGLAFDLVRPLGSQQ